MKMKKCWPDGVPCASRYVTQVILISDLLLEISSHVTNGMELNLLGNGLGLPEDKIRTIQYDQHGNINEAGYRVLLEWRQKRTTQQVGEEALKEELRTVLRSEQVGMNQVVVQLKSKGFSN